MINELLIANETLKLEVKELKKKELSAINERDNLIHKVQSLQSMNNLKDLQCGELEKQLESDFIPIKSLVQELECVVSQVQMNSMEDYMSIASDCIAIKSQLHDSIKLMKSCLEDIWSEIIMKDCAVSVLHLCHIGVLLETVTGLNAENGLLHLGMCESDAVISQLREQNSQSRRELERCRILEGKLLADIKHSYDRISRQEAETGDLSVKLTAFEEKILDLQYQEELMLQRSNCMGSELTILMKDLDLSNRNVLASLLDQERVLKEREELFRTHEDNFIMEISARDLELLILSSELKQATTIRADMEKYQTINSAVIEILKKDAILYSVDASLSDAILVEKEIECSFLKDKCESAEKEQLALLSELEKQNSTIGEMKGLNSVLLLDVQSLKEASLLNDSLKSSIAEVKEANLKLSSQIENLNSESKKLFEEKKMMEATLACSSSQIFTLEQQNQMLQEKICLLETTSSDLQNELESKDAKLEKLSCLEAENKALLCDIGKRKGEFDRVNALQRENAFLKGELVAFLNEKHEYLNTLSLKIAKYVGSVENMHAAGCRSVFLDNMFEEMCINNEIMTRFLEEFEHMEKLAKELTSETVSLQTDLFRKDDILNGLLFDMRLLQESASNIKDQKDECESMLASLDALENELRLKGDDLNEAVSKSQKLEAEVQEKINMISTLELDLAKERENVNCLSCKNIQLVASMKDAVEAKKSMEEELLEKSKVSEDLEKEVAQMGIALAEMNTAFESLRSNLDYVTDERDDLRETLHVLKKELEREKAISEENEALVAEAQEVMMIWTPLLRKQHAFQLLLNVRFSFISFCDQQIAEIRKLQVEDKEEEVKLLERSVEELECTVNVLENKVTTLARLVNQSFFLLVLNLTYFLFFIRLRYSKEKPSDRGYRGRSLKVSFML